MTFGWEIAVINSDQELQQINHKKEKENVFKRMNYCWNGFE